LPIFRIGEVFLAAAVLYHALNGIRIMLVDFLPRATRHHQAIFYGEVVIFVGLMIPGAYFMLKPLF
ncbi:succinate dehydrogenase, cytochrome b556 subunit, partial [candidate division TA06 bacterium]|nr:succinate dehydrogenase, cytochrome b556 subunit [candidate division TA06 bacterium]